MGVAARTDGTCHRTASSTRAHQHARSDNERNSVKEVNIRTTLRSATGLAVEGCF